MSVNRHRWRAALDRALAHSDANGDAENTLRRIAHVVINQALAGEKDAIKEVADRLDGKPVAMVANDDSEPFKLIISATEAKL